MLAISPAPVPTTGNVLPAADANTPAKDPSTLFESLIVALMQAGAGLPQAQTDGTGNPAGAETGDAVSGLAGRHSSAPQRPDASVVSGPAAAADVPLTDETGPPEAAGDGTVSAADSAATSDKPRPQAVQETQDPSCVSSPSPAPPPMVAALDDAQGMALAALLPLQHTAPQGVAPPAPPLSPSSGIATKLPFPTGDAIPGETDPTTVGAALKQLFSAHQTGAPAPPASPSGEGLKPSTDDGATTAASAPAPHNEAHARDTAELLSSLADDQSASLPAQALAPPMSNSAPAIPAAATVAGPMAMPSDDARSDLPFQLMPASGMQDPDIDGLALRIAANSLAGESRFHIRLDPPELGRIDIHLNLDSQGNAQANLSADKPQTLDLLQKDATALEQALKDAGLDLAGGLSFSLKGDGRFSPPRGQPTAARTRTLQIVGDPSLTNEAASAHARVYAQSWVNGHARLDIRI